jgi:hypothetical protein
VIVLTFGTASLYGKCIAILEETSNVNNTSTLQFECNGKNGVNNIVYWNFGVNGPTNTYPWANSISTTGTTITFNPNTGSRTYNWYFSMQIVNGTLSSITQDSVVVQTFNF